MAFSFSPKIVTDGLVLALDAANPRSYVSGSTVWNNLTPNLITGSLVNGPIFNSANGGSIQFDGTNDYVRINAFNPLTSDFSINVWFKQNVYSTSNDAIISNRNPSVDNGWIFDTTSSKTVRMYIQNSGATVYSVSSTTLINLNEWYNACITRSGTLLTLYLNSVPESNTNLSSNYSINSPYNTDIIGSYQAVTSLFDGNISSITIYKNKFLSAQEVLQNYNALKGRFNLT